MGQPCEFQVGEPCEDFAARRTSWLAAYRQALKRRAAASASGHDGIPAPPTPWGSGGGRGGDDQDAEAARPGATSPREKDPQLAQKLGQLQPFVAAQKTITTVFFPSQVVGFWLAD
jgi:hypothetical protein